MQKIITKYVQINTNAQLLNAYELLALGVARERESVDFTNLDEPARIVVSFDDNIGVNLALVNLNAAIIEGTLRTLFSDILDRDYVVIGELLNEKKADKNHQQIFRSYGMLKQLRDEVELKGGWDNIKKNYKEYAGLDIDKICTSCQKNAMDTIFIIRNSASHGTAFTMPKVKMVENQKDLYPYKWQNKLHGMNVYVKKEFDLEFFDALRHPDFAKHFMELTKDFFRILSELDLFPDESRFHFKNLEDFVFGKNSSFSRKYRKENSQPK